MKALKPELSNNEIADLLRKTARNLGKPGHDSYYGASLDIEKMTDQLMGEFVNDSLEMTVSTSKIFTVTFNQDLVLSKD